jgi:hypothetical protein
MAALCSFMDFKMKTRLRKLLVKSCMRNASGKFSLNDDNYFQTHAIAS